MKTNTSIDGHTPGPWPWEFTGDGKRITIGDGLVEGPNGYEVAEVYSDDCPRETAIANACVISAAPELLEALAEVFADHSKVNSLMWTDKAAAALAKARGDA